MHPKVAASTLAGALTVLVVYGVSFAGIEPPLLVQLAVVTIFSSVAGWFKRGPESPAA